MRSWETAFHLPRPIDSARQRHALEVSRAAGGKGRGLTFDAPLTSLMRPFFVVFVQDPGNSSGIKTGGPGTFGVPSQSSPFF